MTGYATWRIFPFVKRLTLKQARAAKRWTQEQLEAVSGIEQQHISKLERGAITDPSFSTVTKLATALGVDPRALRFGRGTQPESLAS